MLPRIIATSFTWPSLQLPTQTHTNTYKQCTSRNSVFMFLFFSFFSLSHHSRFLTVSFFSLLFSQYSPSFCFVLYRLFFHNKFRQHNSQSAFLFFCYLYAQVRNILATVVLFFVFYFAKKVKSKHFDTKNVSSEKNNKNFIFILFWSIPHFRSIT